MVVQLKPIHLADMLKESILLGHIHAHHLGGCQLGKAQIVLM